MSATHKPVSYVHMDTVIEDYLDFSDEKGYLDKRRVKKLANDCLMRMVPADALVESILLIPINHYRGEVETGVEKIIQAGYIADPQKRVRKEQVIEAVIHSNNDCKINVELDCPDCKEHKGEIILEYDRIYEMLRPEHYYKHMSHYYRAGGADRGSMGYAPDFRLMKPATNHFHNAKFHIPGCVNLDFDSEVAYRFDPPNITVNFESGQVLLAVLKRPMGDDGYLLVPNLTEVFTAINWWIEERLLYVKVRNTRDANEYKMVLGLYDRAVTRKNSAVALAREKLSTPQFSAWWKFINNHWRKVRPYYDFDEKLNREETDRFRTDFPTY